MASQDQMQSPFELKQSKIFKSLGNKISVIRNILGSALIMTGDTVDGDLDNLWRKTFNSVPINERRSYIEEGTKEAVAILNRRGVYDAYDKIELQELSNSEDSRFITQNEGSSIMQKELRARDGDYSFEFLKTIKLLIRNLQRKHRQVAELTRRPEELSRNIAEKLGRNIAIGDIVDIKKLDAFTITIVVRARKFGDIAENKNQRGFHIHDTPLCVVKEGSDGIGWSIEHERIHALSDGIITISNPSSRVARLINSGVFSHSNFNVNSYLKSANARADIQGILDDLHGEMAACAYRAIHETFARDYSSETTTIDVPTPTLNDDDDLKRYISAFATAGRQASDVLENLYAERTQFEVSPVATALESFAEAFKCDFLKMGRGVEKAAIQIKGIRPEMRFDAEQELVILMCIIKPSKYYHAPNYMRAWLQTAMKRPAHYAV